MRLILLGRVIGRQLCRVGLHRWRRVRNLSSLDAREHGLSGTTFLVTGHYFTDRCVRPGCGKERDA